MAGILSGLWKGLFGTKQDELNERATEESIFQMQHPFARTMQDASNYGLNPMTALGATPSQATFSGSSMQSNASQLLGMLPSIISGSVSRTNSKESNTTQKDIAGNNNTTTKEVAKGNNETQVEVAKTNANAQIKVAEKNAQAMEDLRKSQAEQARVQTGLLTNQFNHQNQYGYVPNAPVGANALSMADNANSKGQAIADEMNSVIYPSDSWLSSKVRPTYQQYKIFAKRLISKGKLGKMMSKDEYKDFMERYYR